jgi:hypothetical protein
MVIVKATKESEAGVLPDQKLLAAMGQYNEELDKAGVMLAGEGLQPSSKGARVRFSGATRTVIDGPFAETKEQLLGFYVIDCASLDEAIDFARDLGRGETGALEIRPLRHFESGSGVR